MMMMMQHIAVLYFSVIWVVKYQVGQLTNDDDDYDYDDDDGGSGGEDDDDEI